MRNFTEFRLVGEKFDRYAVNLHRTGVDFAFRIHVLVVVLIGESTIDDFQCRYFDDAVTQRRIQSRGFRVEDDLAHSLGTRGEQDFCDAAVREFIGFFISRIAGVTLDPDPFNLVGTHQLIEPLP